MRRRTKTAERMRLDNARRYESNKALIEEMKAGVPCADCGESHPPYVLEFDHRPGETKLFKVAAGKGRSRGALLAEMAKCDIVCANCHRVRTHNREGAYGIRRAVPLPPRRELPPAKPTGVQRWTKRT